MTTGTGTYPPPEDVIPFVATATANNAGEITYLDQLKEM